MIFSFGKVAVVCGGTGFYIDALMKGLPAPPPSSTALRKKLHEELAAYGAEALFDELSRFAPKSAAVIHKNNTYRLLRAVEVLRLSGKPLSDFPRRVEPAPSEKNSAGFFFVNVTLCMRRELLYERIEQRCKKMFASGLAAEVEALYAKGYTPACPALRAIGYKEFFYESDGGYKLRGDIDEVFALVVKNSRHYAKRQETWFRHQLQDAAVIDVDGTDAGNARAAEQLAEYVAGAQHGA